MIDGPIFRAWRTRTGHRRAVEGPWPGLIRLAGLLIATGLLIPLVRAVFMGWLDGPLELRQAGVPGVLLRMDLVLIGWVGLDVYSALVRDGDREVLGIWPVDPNEVVRFELVRHLVSWLPRWLVMVALLSPLLTLGPSTFLIATVHLLGVLLVATALAASCTLLAVTATDHPSLRPLIDLLRGTNHPAQTAFIYAPGFVLLVAGGLAWVSTLALGAPLPVAALLLLLPFIVAGLALLPVPGLADRTWFRAGQVVADIDARYAVLDGPEDARAVYLDWTVRVLPTDVARYALKDLRHGWRSRRAWVSGPWLLGLLTLVGTWTADPGAIFRTTLLIALSTWLIAACSLALEADEPEFLRAWLPDATGQRALARVFVVGLWSLPPLGFGVLGVVFWHGPLAALAMVIVWSASVVLGGGLGMLSSGRGGLALYGPLAASAIVLIALVLP